MSEQSPRRSLNELVNAIAYDVREQLDPGEVADLRRMSPEGPLPGAFWRLLARHLDGPGDLPPEGAARLEAERRWAVILSAVALMGDLHQPGERLGNALATHLGSELRVLRLLRAHGRSLADAIRLTCRALGSAGASVDVAEIARLVLSDGREDEEPTRRRVARSYYSALHHKGLEQKEVTA